MSSDAYEEWWQEGKANGWLSTPDGHKSVDPEGLWDLDLSEWCAAHHEGLYCCLDHKDVYLVREDQEQT